MSDAPATPEASLIPGIRDDRDALSYGKLLLAEMGKLSRDPRTQNDSISVHWHEVDGARASAAYSAILRLEAEAESLRAAIDAAAKETT